MERGWMSIIRPPADVRQVPIADVGFDCSITSSARPSSGKGTPLRYAIRDGYAAWLRPADALDPAHRAGHQWRGSFMPVFKKIHYAWIIVGVPCLVLLTSAGIRSTPGILMVPLEEEFHWSRATIGFAVSINLILYGCIGPFAAAIMERFGIRRSVLCALTLVGLGVASTSLMQYPWQLILMWGVLVGAGTGFLATVLSTIIAARWFTAQRGLALGILSGGASTGQLIFLPVMANVTAAYGWRTTVLAIAGVLCVVIPLVALIMRDRPQDVGLEPYGETGQAEPVRPIQGNPIALAFGALRVAV